MRDRPAYRAAHTPEACTTQELLAAVIRGSDRLPGASALLDQFRDLQAISMAAQQELTQIPGIGPARAASLKAALELGRRLKTPAEDAPTIQSPDDAASLLMPKIGHLEKERLMVLILNTRNRLIGDPIEVYNGSLNASMVRVGEVFRPALHANAAAIIIAHNHPSGDITPSPEDIALTKAFVQAGRMLDVDVLDHLIVSSSTYISLKARGLGFG
ncbi:MAG: DNA repair protein RadC [Anaerolineales bacterium]|nr:MAG: DNA repair protein RadC [Anaerolineales bacterium]